MTMVRKVQSEKNKKGPGRPAGPSVRGCRGATPQALAGVLLSVLGEEALIGLVGALCHVGDDRADLGDLTDIALIGRADILGLDLDGLVESAGGKQLLESGGARREGLLGIVRGFRGESLQALADRAGADQRE